MKPAAYPAPIARLFRLGDPKNVDTPYTPTHLHTDDQAAMRAEAEAAQNRKYDPMPFNSTHWPDYPAVYGLGPESIPALIQLVGDESFNDMDENDAAIYAPVHAWRALGQLRATEAIAPLIALLTSFDGYDWFTEEVPEVFGMIGPTALPALAAYLNDTGRIFWTRSTAANGITAIGRMHPEARDDAIAAITATLAASLDDADPDDDLPTLNGFLITDLMDLDAAEAVPLIHRVAAAGLLDDSVAGDREDIEIGFGVRTERDTPRLRYQPFFRDEFPPDDLLPPAGGAAERKATAAKKEKRKRDTAKQSRRTNRKKKYVLGTGY